MSVFDDAGNSSLTFKGAASSQIKAAYGVMVGEGGIPSERPDAEEAWVIDWPDAGLVIPWPHGLTLREAVREWLHATWEIADPQWGYPSSQPCKR